MSDILHAVDDEICIILVRRRKLEEILARPRRKWDNIKSDHIETVCEGLYMSA